MMKPKLYSISPLCITRAGEDTVILFDSRTSEILNARMFGESSTSYSLSYAILQEIAVNLLSIEAPVANWTSTEKHGNR